MGDLPDAPEGTRSIFISMKKLETYGLKTGDGVQDLVDSKVLSREALLEEIQKLGFMSDFHEAKADIDAYPDAELLLVRDVGQKHGNDWLLCTTAEAKARFLDAAEAERAAAEAAEREALEAEAARRAAEEAKRSIVYVDGPTIANSWVSEHSEETAADIQKLNVRPRRPLLGFSVTCPRGLVERPLGLQQRNVEGVLEYRTHKVPAEDFVAVRLAEIGVQAAPRFSDSDTQTNWQRPVNKATETRSSEAATREPAGSRDAPSADDILAFLSRTAPLAEEALLQNETVNVFSDAFAHVQREEEASLGAKGENDLKELRTFTDLRFSKNNVLSAIDWLPQSRTTLAVSVIRDLGFDARVAVAGQVERAYILLWSFEDLIHPQLKLRAPKEVMCFRFCETRPAVVAAGLLNGQVALWDTTASMELLRQRRQKGHSHQRNGAAEDLGDGELPPLEPIAVSHIEASHKRMVSDLIWLPWNTQVNSRGQLVDKENLTPGVSHQFVTVAGDGHLLIWDTRYEGIVNGEFPFLARPKGMKEVHGDREKDSENKEATPWLPLFKIQLKRIDGVGELTLCRVCLAGLPLAPGGDGSRSGFFCATEEGDIVFADWRAKQCQGASNDDDEEDEAHGALDCVQWMARDHSRPCVSLQRSPFFSHVFLSVGDWSFQLWRADCAKPIFSSPISDAYLACGRWSPTRPGVLFVARVDGTIDVWDFSDSCYRPWQRLNASPTRITSMEFLLDGKGRVRDSAEPQSQQLLGVGDAGGNLHVFDVPRPLSRALPNEESVMESFLRREVDRADATNDISGVARAGDLGDVLEGASVHAAEHVNDVAKGQDRKRGVQGDGLVDGDDVQAEAIEAELAYRELEKRFVASLGLRPEDIPTLGASDRA